MSPRGVGRLSRIFRRRRISASGTEGAGTATAIATVAAVGLSFSTQGVGVAVGTATSSVVGLAFSPQGVGVAAGSSSASAASGSAGDIDVGNGIFVRSGHPRLHYTPETLPTVQGWMAGEWNAPFQTIVTAAVQRMEGQDPPNYPGLYADYYAFVWLMGSVAGINYWGKTINDFGNAAVQAMRDQVAQGPAPTNQLWGQTVNHPYHTQDETIHCMARAWDWMFNYAGFTNADKISVSGWFAAAPLNIVPRAGVNFNPKTVENAPGSEDQHPAYWGLAFAGDGYQDAAAVTLIASFSPHWLEGQHVDMLNYEARGDFGQRVLGSYGGWYPVRPIHMLHAWKVATGIDYFSDPTPVSPAAVWATGLVKTQIALEKAHRPGSVIPLGQSPGNILVNSPVCRMLTGCLEDVPERGWAASLGGTVPSDIGFQYIFQEMLTANADIAPVAPPTSGYWFSTTYGLLVQKRTDQTHLTMGAPIISLRGHTWASQGGAARDAVPLGCTLTVAGTPVLVKHIGDYRGASRGCYGQNAMRFYRAGMTPAESDGDTAWTGGFNGGYTSANKVTEIVAGDNMGGISSYTDGHAVANLTKWYLSTRVSAYTRTYDWGSTSFDVQDSVTLVGDAVAWSRWYTGHVPVINGVQLSNGITDYSTAQVAAGLTIVLGPVTWTYTAPANTSLRVVGGPTHRWIDDNWVVDTFQTFDPQSSDNPEWSEGGGAIENGEWNFTFIGSPGGGTWTHHFAW